MSIKKKIVLAVLATVLACLIVVKLFPTEFIANVKIVGGSVQQSSGSVVSAGATAAQTTPTASQPSADSSKSDAPAEESKADVQKEDKKSDSSSSKKPETTEEIVTKYAEVIKKFKHEKPAYTKKEYQALPEESRQFSSSLVNRLLGFADNYMTKEDSDAAIVVREAGYEDIINEIPIYGIEDGCLLKDYSAVQNATCTENADGTYTLSFGLAEEKNPACPISGSTEPQSNHGAVLMPGNRDDIMVEVNKIEKMTGATCNSFDMTYRDCTFECVYNPANDQLVSITHHANIDIDADIHFITDITGSARLTNDMLVYDVKW